MLSTKGGILGQRGVLSFPDKASRGRGVGVASVRYSPAATNMSNDAGYQLTDMTGISDAKTVSMSFWVKLDSTNDETDFVWYGRGAMGESQSLFQKNITGSVNVQFASGATVPFQAQVAATGTIPADDAWHHVALCVDLGGAESSKQHFLVDGVEKTLAFTALVDATINATPDSHTVGASNSFGQSVEGSISEFWMAFGQYVDFTDSATLQKFRTSGGAPVNLGADGSVPTSTAPSIYLTGDTDTFATNLGAAGNFTASGTPADDAAGP